MKEKTWDTPNKMHFASGFATFDRQTNIITTGNVIANTQYSWFIRSYYETECNGFSFPPGHLQMSDLKFFTKEGLPEEVVGFIRKIDTGESVILYNFHHWLGPSHRPRLVMDGWVLTDSEHNHIKTWHARGSIKSMLAVEEANKYVCN